jgi:CheY-like chemotaxis protein
MPTTAQIPVIILSNYGDPELRERGLRLGALEFLVKADVTPYLLVTKIEQNTGVLPAALEMPAPLPQGKGWQEAGESRPLPVGGVLWIHVAVTCVAVSSRTSRRMSEWRRHWVYRPALPQLRRSSTAARSSALRTRYHQRT